MKAETNRVIRRVPVVLIPNPGSQVITVVCPQVPGAISEGEGEDTALKNVREAIEAVAESRALRGLQPIVDDDSLIEAEKEHGYEIIREAIADELVRLLSLDEPTAREIYPHLLEFATVEKNIRLNDALQVTVRNVEVAV